MEEIEIFKIIANMGPESKDIAEEWLKLKWTEMIIGYIAATGLFGSFIYLFFKHLKNP